MCRKRRLSWSRLPWVLLLSLLLLPPAYLSADPTPCENFEPLRQNLLEVRKLLENWNNSLSERESEIASKEQFLTEIETRLSEREAAWQQNEAALQEKESSLQEKELRLSERERILSENESDYLASDQLIIELKASLTKVSGSLASAEKKVIALEFEVGIWRVAGPAAGITAVVFAVLYFLSK